MRYLIISDIHSNLAALEAVLADAPVGLPVWCLGDLVGYGPNPNECIEKLRELDVQHIVVGNHDCAVIGRADIEDFNAEANAAVRWTREQLTPGNLEYLESFPECVIQDQFTLVHGSPRKPIWEYIFHPYAASLNFAYFDTPYCLVGHTHMPLVFSLQKQEEPPTCQVEQFWDSGIYEFGASRVIVNPGSVGQPRDGDARASYAILDTEALIWEYHRVAYDIKKTQKQMQLAGLPSRLVVRLSYGW